MIFRVKIGGGGQRAQEPNQDADFSLHKAELGSQLERIFKSVKIKSAITEKVGSTDSKIYSRDV